MVVWLTTTTTRRRRTSTPNRSYRALFLTIISLMALYTRGFRLSSFLSKQRLAASTLCRLQPPPRPSSPTHHHQHHTIFFSTSPSSDSSPSSLPDLTFGDRIPFQKLGLSEELVSSLGNQGKAIATAIQAMSIPLINEGKDVIIGSETGGGKTLAYLLPLIDKYYLRGEPQDYDPRAPQAMVLVPNRQLADQVLRMAKEVLPPSLAPEDVRKVSIASSCLCQYSVGGGGGSILVPLLRTGLLSVLLSMV